MKESLMECREREACEVRRLDRLEKESRFVEPSDKEVALFRKVQDGDHKDETVSGASTENALPEVRESMGRV